MKLQLWCALFHRAPFKMRFPQKIRLVRIAFFLESDSSVRNNLCFLLPELCTQQGSELAEPEGIVTCQCYRECWFLWLLWLIQRWGFRRHAPMLQWPLSLRGWYLFEEAGWMRLPSSYRLYLLPYSSTPTHSKLGMGSCLSPLQLLGVWLRYGVASTDPQCHQWLPDCLAATRYLWKRGSRNVSC